MKNIPKVEISSTVLPRFSAPVLEHITVFISVVSALIKIRITSLVSFTTALGYILYSHKLDFEIIYPVLGIFLLACSSAAVNHFQDRKIDAKMNRTKNRPLVNGSVTPVQVISLSLILLLSGGVLLLYKTNIITLIIGLLTFFWYNIVYTPLKRVTPFAVIPGSLVGALPPLAGWTAAGGNILDSNILYVCLYFFIWQIPHFWLLVLAYSDDYKEAGLPVLTDIMKIKSITIFTFFWIIFLMFISAGMIFFGIIDFNFLKIILIFSIFVMLFSAVAFLKSEINRKNIFRLFNRINLFTIIVIILLSINKLI
jgi:protoheme IX farnesyltransferase